MRIQTHRLTIDDLAYMAEVNAEHELPSRISMLKWAIDLARSAGADKDELDALDDILTEYKHIMHRRAQKEAEGQEQPSA